VSTQHTLDGFGPKMLGRPRHFPARDRWHQWCKIQLDDPLKLRESKERPQGGFHLSSPTASMSRRMTPDKRPYLRDSKDSKIDSPAAELLGQEPVDVP
jgi:hypothetical protein